MVVLVVEDDTDTAETLCRGLEAEGFTTIRATNGQQAIDLIETNDYDAVTLDILLPQASGWEVIERVRAEGIHIPLVVVTALSGVDDRVAALDKGADDYLVKPVAIAELAARLRVVTRRTETGVPVLALGDLELNVATHELRRGGRIIPLTTREYAIMELLLRHPGRVLTRNMILEHVYGFDYSLTSNVVDVHIGRLRRKLDEGFTLPSIRTVRDVGYRLAG